MKSAVHFNHSNQPDLILLQVRPEGASNAIGNPLIPTICFPTAKNSVQHLRKVHRGHGHEFRAQQGDKAFFKNQAQTHIALALEALYLGGWDVTLENAHEVLLDDSQLDDVLCHLAGDPMTRPERHNTSNRAIF